jgi:hypothetical protein
LGDRSSPTYNTGDKKFGAPRIQLPVINQVHSRRVRLMKIASRRLDLNNPPTAVGGIKSIGSVNCRPGTFAPLTDNLKHIGHLVEALIEGLYLRGHKT